MRLPISASLTASDTHGSSIRLEMEGCSAVRMQREGEEIRVRSIGKCIELTNETLGKIRPHNRSDGVCDDFLMREWRASVPETGMVHTPDV